MDTFKELNNSSSNFTGFKGGVEEEHCANCDFEIVHETPFMAIIFLFRSINIVLHSFGSHLLISLYKIGRSKSPQTLFIIHLSIVAILRNIILIVIQVMDNPMYYTYDIFPVMYSLVMIADPSFDLMYFLSMYYLTIDRLLAIRLNLKYKVICTIRKIKYLLVASWFVAIAIGVCLIVLFKITEEPPYIPPIPQYAHLGVSVVYLVLAIVTYTTLFRSFRNSLATKKRDKTTNGQKPLSIWGRFRKSKFIVSVLLIASCLLLVVMPEIGYILGGMHINFEYPKSRPLVYTMGILLVLSDSVDALIYIFLQSKVRRLFFEKLGCLRNALTARSTTARTTANDARKSTNDLNVSVITLNNL